MHESRDVTVRAVLSSYSDCSAAKTEEKEGGQGLASS